jgi:hypothetical protein
MMTDGPVAGAGPGPQVCPGPTAPTLFLDFDVIDPAINACRQAASDLDSTRRSVVGALADAAGASGFPGLAGAVAAFGDLANSHLATVASDFNAVAAQVATFKASIIAKDKALGLDAPYFPASPGLPGSGALGGLPWSPLSSPTGGGG